MAQILILVVMFALLWAVLIRPQKAKQQKQQQLLKSIEPGDEILTVGGIFGIVQSIDEDDELITEIAEGVHVRVARRAVATVVKAEDDDADEAEVDDADTDDADGGESEVLDSTEGEVDGRYTSDPSLAAATTFAGQLRKAGIRIIGAPQHRRTPHGSSLVAQVRSAPLGEIVQHLLAVSDNNAAEVVARHAAIAAGRSGSFEGAVATIRSTLGRLGVDTTGLRLYDGSGLSRHDRIDPRTIVGVLRIASGPAHPRLREVVTGLPIAGFSGSLASRYDSSPEAALGRVRAKTGTLTGVSALAGTTADLDGDQLYFAVMADKIKPADTMAARQAEERITAALGACHCGRGR